MPTLFQILFRDLIYINELELTKILALIELTFWQAAIKIIII